MSFTGIGRIGSQHTLTSPQDNTLYLFNGTYWCTHPLLDIAFVGSQIDTTEGSKVVTGIGSSFTELCNDIQTNNIPLNKYIAFDSGTGLGILEVDYVIDNTTLILKQPAIATITIASDKAKLINYWGTPILKEITATPATGGSGTNPLVIVNKYSSNTYTLFDNPWTETNEGGLEPMLFTASADYFIKLSY